MQSRNIVCRLQKVFVQEEETNTKRNPYYAWQPFCLAMIDAHCKYASVEWFVVAQMAAEVVVRIHSDSEVVLMFALFDVLIWYWRSFCWFETGVVCWSDMNKYLCYIAPNQQFYELSALYNSTHIKFQDISVYYKLLKLA